MFLVIWDKIFGTFQAELPAEQYQPLKYGLTKPLESETPTKVIFHEWNDIRKDLQRTDISWREKMGYFFGPPGWSHDGSRQTSEELREMESNYRKVAGRTIKTTYLIPIIFPAHNILPDKNWHFSR